MNQSARDASSPHRSMGSRLRTIFSGQPKDPLAPGIFRKVSLVAFMAWIGLGANGLSSSVYGPDEAFRALGQHTYLAVALAVATTFTVLIISYAYSRIIEQFLFRRRRLRGGDETAGPQVWCGLGLGSAGGLCPDHFGLDCRGRGCHLQLAAVGLAPLEGSTGARRYRPLHGHERARVDGVRDRDNACRPALYDPHAILILGTIAMRAGEFREITHAVHTGFQSGVVTLGWDGHGLHSSCTPTRRVRAPIPGSKPSRTSRSCESREWRPRGAP